MADHGIQCIDGLVRQGQWGTSDRQIQQRRNHTVRRAFRDRFHRRAGHLGFGELRCVAPHDHGHSSTGSRKIAGLERILHRTDMIP